MPLPTLDESLGRFVARLKATPQWKDLLIICVADHGYSELGSDDRNSTAAAPHPAALDRWCSALAPCSMR